ncbi:hypothetical protein HED49_08320 [Ochrobactrum daejeonense]|nr:hypothetical protein [Brucella daejeonensis]
MDWLKDGTGAEHDYRQWFQLAPEWALSGADGILSASCHDTKLKVVSLISNTTLGDIYSGTTDPMQGWHSPKAGVLEPSTSFNFHTREIQRDSPPYSAYLITLILIRSNSTKY